MDDLFCIDDTFAEEIVSLLPSNDLKAEIRKRNHKFSEEELLQIAYTYAPTFYERISILERFSKNASRDLSALARTYINYEKDNLKRFTENASGFIYELLIKTTPDSYEEKYICETYDDAIACIDCFYEEYKDVDAKETSKSRYRIIKRRIFKKDSPFEEDAYAECVLGANKKVIEVSDYRNPADCDLDIMCGECKKNCPRRHIDVIYPCFVANHSIIRYHDYEGRECFGVNLCSEKECDGLSTELYIIPLHSSVIREHMYDTDFYDHEHVELPNAELAAPEDLDETDKKNYYSFIAYLNETHE